MVKTSDCGSDMHGFESHQAPHKKADDFCYLLFYYDGFVGLTEPNEAKPSNGFGGCILLSVLVGSVFRHCEGKSSKQSSFC